MTPKRKRLLSDRALELQNAYLAFKDDCENFDIKHCSKEKDELIEILGGGTNQWSFYIRMLEYKHTRNEVERLGEELGLWSTIPGKEYE